MYLDEFGDVDGWDLYHVRRVRWLNAEYKEFPLRTFGAQADRFSRVWVEAVQQWVEKLDVTTNEDPLPALPRESRDISENDLADGLSRKGISSGLIARVLAGLARARQIARWYRDEYSPLEHEAVAHQVVPLLRSLGWDFQTLALDWERIDVAIFRTLPRTDSNLIGVVEAKTPHSSVFRALGQAAYYASLGERSNCKYLVVTDGLRYALYTKIQGVFPEKPSAYFNLLRMREAYPIYGCGGAIDFIYGLMRETQAD